MSAAGAAAFMARYRPAWELFAVFNAIPLPSFMPKALARDSALLVHQPTAPSRACSLMTCGDFRPYLSGSWILTRLEGGIHQLAEFVELIEFDGQLALGHSGNPPISGCCSGGTGTGEIKLDC